MTNTELLQQGIQLMLVGMGFVMVFLLILIYAISLMSKFVQRFFPETAVPISTKSAVQSTHLNNDVETLRPVIVAAIHHHRRQQGL